jgi:hypothetical protein
MTGASSMCADTCSGETICVTSMDCSMGQRCMRGADGVRVCTGVTDAAGGG